MTRLYIREWRHYRGQHVKGGKITQEQLAALSDCSTGTISRMENGKQNYTRDNLVAIARALDCEVAELFSRPPLDDEVALQRRISKMTPDALKLAARIIAALDEEAA